MQRRPTIVSGTMPSNVVGLGRGIGCHLYKKGAQATFSAQRALAQALDNVSSRVIQWLWLDHHVDLLNRSQLDSGGAGPCQLHWRYRFQLLATMLTLKFDSLHIEFDKTK
ncbi:MAG: hypothetical protein ACR2Q4_22720 [Geminicoccaceae bacterium]